MRARRLAIPLLLLLGACDSATSPELTNSPVQVDSSVIQITHCKGDSRARIDVTYRNETADTVAVKACASLWRREGGRWQLVNRIPLWGVRCLSPDVLVAPGTEYRRTLWFIYIPGFDPQQPVWQGSDLSGTYRVQLDDVTVHSSSATSNGRLLPQAPRVSSSFAMRDNHDPPIAETDCAKHYSYETVGFFARESGHYWVSGVLSFWFDTQRVCLAFGVWDNSVVPVLEANLQKYGVPRDMVYIHVESPVFAL